MGADFNRKAYQEIYRHNAWEQTADKYEEEFAARLYKTPYVQQAAKTALTKLSRMLNAYYRNPNQTSGMNEEAVEDAQVLGQVAAEEVHGFPFVLQRHSATPPGLTRTSSTVSTGSGSTGSGPMSAKTISG